ncbi:MAG: DNA polymerase III subunit epsilon [Paracoccaceae bacterium]
MIREIVLDTETTGLNPLDGHKIVELAAIELIDHVKTENKFHHYINPEREIPEAAQKIHNITYDMVRDKPVFKEIVQEFLNFIKDDSIIIHNADFDLKFLNYELSLNRINNLQNKITDTLAIARSKYPGSSVSLDSLCKRFNIDKSERSEKGHGALIDCYLLSEVYLEMIGGKQPNLNLNKKNINKLTKKLEQKKQNFLRKKKLESIIDEKILETHIEFIKKINCEDIWKFSHRKMISKINKKPIE